MGRQATRRKAKWTGDVDRSACSDGGGGGGVRVPYSGLIRGEHDVGYQDSVVRCSASTLRLCSGNRCDRVTT